MRVLSTEPQSHIIYILFEESGRDLKILIQLGIISNACTFAHIIKSADSSIGVWYGYGLCRHGCVQQMKMLLIYSGFNDLPSSRTENHLPFCSLSLLHLHHCGIYPGIRY